MNFLLFPDNTVLVNFGHIDQVELLEELLTGHGRWTITIAQECQRSAEVTGLGGLAAISVFLREPITPTGAERVTTGIIRAALASRADRDTDHLGEAETLAVITTRSPDSIFVTDDVPAARHARALNVRTMSTAEVLKLGVRSQRVSIEQAWGHIETLRGMKRTLPHCPLTLGQFRRWCADK